MRTERYVVVGLATARSPWFRSMAHWVTAGVLPVEFVPCVSVDELRARVGTGRPFSAVLIDADVTGLDRDVIDGVTARGCAVVIVDDRDRDWSALGAQAALPRGFDPRELLDALRAHAALIGSHDGIANAAESVAGSDPAAPAVWRGRVAAVCGPGGTGASTVAIALAQAMAADIRHGGLVVLADLARRGDQAMLHDAGDVVPGVEELVELHRVSRPTRAEVRAQTFAVEARNYHLLLGLRRPRGWTALRRRAVESAMEALAHAYRVVVCDCDNDIEGEDETGSAEVEDRNVLARTAIAAADVVFVVGAPGLKGTHSLAGLMTELAAFDVDPRRIVPVINRAPRQQRQRTEAARALAELAPGASGALAAPLFLPERSVDEALRDGTLLHPSLVAPLGTAFSTITRALPSVGRVDAEPAPEPVAAGSLGHWTDEEAG
jgi:hypothetical protein